MVGPLNITTMMLLTIYDRNTCYGLTRSLFIRKNLPVTFRS
jgi:hypothetical protein